MRVVATYPTTEAAYLAASRLESAGIDVEVRDAAIVSLNWMYTLAIGGVKLAVVEADEADARAILSLPALAPGLLVCPYCGSPEVAARTLSPAGGVLLATGLPLPLAPQVADCRRCGKTFPLAVPPAESAAE